MPECNVEEYVGIFLRITEHMEWTYLNRDNMTDYEIAAVMDTDEAQRFKKNPNYQVKCKMSFVQKLSFIFSFANEAVRPFC